MLWIIIIINFLLIILGVGSLRHLLTHTFSCTNSNYFDFALIPVFIVSMIILYGNTKERILKWSISSARLAFIAYGLLALFTIQYLVLMASIRLAFTIAVPRRTIRSSSRTWKCSRLFRFFLSNLSFSGRFGAERSREGHPCLADWNMAR